MIYDAVGLIVESWASAFGGPIDYPERHCNRSANELIAASEGDPAGLADRVDAIVTRWETVRLADIAGEFKE